MKEDMVATGVKKIAMPKIGCGLDRLNWNIVRSIIKEVFEDTDIEILICIREDEKEQEDAEEDMEEDEMNLDGMMDEEEKEEEEDEEEDEERL